MSSFPISIFRSAAVVTLVTGLALAGPLTTAHANTNGLSPGGTSQTQQSHSPQAMSQRVEDRIQTLHDKLGITDMQETEWGAVAQAMRENESAISQLIQARHQDPANMTAIDDLQSYETINQAHVDGLKKLIPAFQALYNDMPDRQKKVADQAFGSFEGHMSDKKHS